MSKKKELGKFITSFNVDYSEKPYISSVNFGGEYKLNCNFDFINEDYVKEYNVIRFKRDKRYEKKIKGSKKSIQSNEEI